MLQSFNNASSRLSRRILSFFIFFNLIWAHFLFSQQLTAHASSSFQEVQTSWGGYVAQGPRGTYKGVQAHFTVPTLAPGDGLIDTWVGVGDGHFNPTVLVQTGIRSSWDSSTHRQVNQAWWWVVGDKIATGSIYQLFNSSKIHAGDNIWAYMTSNANGDFYDYFRIQDMNTGVKLITPGFSYHNSLALADSAAAECVVETHSDTPSNSGTVNFSGCEVSQDNSKGSQTWIPMGNVQDAFSDPQNYYTQHLTLTGNGNTFATTGDLSNGTDFVVTLDGNNSAGVVATAAPS